MTKTESPLSQVPRPRPRPRLEGSKTKTETKTLRFEDQDQDQDSEVPRPRPRPRPRLVKTGLETSRDQDSSLENSKSGWITPNVPSTELSTASSLRLAVSSKSLYCIYSGCRGLGGGFRLYPLKLNRSGWNLEHKNGSRCALTQNVHGKSPQRLHLRMPKRVLFFVTNTTGTFGHLPCTDFGSFWNKRHESVCACTNR